MFQIQCFLFGFICFYGIISKNDEETLSGSLIALVICMWWKTYYLAMSSLQNWLTKGKVYQSSGSSKWADWPSSKLPIDLTLINSFLVDFRVVHYEAWALGCHQPFRVLRKCTPTDARSQRKIASIDHSWAHAVFYSRWIIWCGFFSLYFLSAAHLFISHPSQLPVSFSCFAHFNRVSSKYLDHSTCRSEDDNKYILSLLSDTVKKKCREGPQNWNVNIANNDTAFRKAKVVTSLFVFAGTPFQCFKTVRKPPYVSTSSSC